MARGEEFSGNGEDLKIPQSKQQKSPAGRALFTWRLSGSPCFHFSFQDTFPNLCFGVKQVQLMAPIGLTNTCKVTGSQSEV